MDYNVLRLCAPPSGISTGTVAAAAAATPRPRGDGLGVRGADRDVLQENVVGTKKDANLGQIEGVDIVVILPVGVHDLDCSQVPREREQELLGAAVDQGQGISTGRREWISISGIQHVL